MTSLTGQFDREVEGSLRRIDESIGPYTRFVRAERDHLGRRPRGAERGDPGAAGAAGAGGIPLGSGRVSAVQEIWVRKCSSFEEAEEADQSSGRR